MNPSLPRQHGVKTMICMHDILEFGKHAGKCVEDVVENNPEYIRWLLENTDIEFDYEVEIAVDRE